MLILILLFGFQSLNDIEALLEQQKLSLTLLDNKKKEIEGKLASLNEPVKISLNEFIEKFPERIKVKIELEKAENEYKNNKQDKILGEEAFSKVIKGRAALTFATKDAKKKYDEYEKEITLKSEKDKKELELQNKLIDQEKLHLEKAISENTIRISAEKAKTKPNEIKEKVVSVNDQNSVPIPDSNNLKVATEPLLFDGCSCCMPLFIGIVLFTIYFLRNYFKKRKNKVDQTLSILNGSGQFSTKVVGASQYQNNLLAIYGPKQKQSLNKIFDAVLVLENNNKFDRNAVAVFINNLLVGYLSRDEALVYRKHLVSINYLHNNLSCKAKIIGGWDDGRGNEGHFGVVLDLNY